MSRGSAGRSLRAAAGRTGTPAAPWGTAAACRRREGTWAGSGVPATRKWGRSLGVARMRALIRQPGDVVMRPRGAGLGGVGGGGLGRGAACGVKQQQQAAGPPVLSSLVTFSDPPRMMRKETFTPRVREWLQACMKVLVQIGKPVPWARRADGRAAGPSSRGVPFLFDPSPWSEDHDQRKGSVEAPPPPPL